MNDEFRQNEHARMRPTFLTLIATVMFFTVVGCQSQYFQPPGPMRYQQASATVHDPFPQGDLGPSDLASRPPGYQQPVPQPVRNRFGRDTMPWLGVQGP